MTISRRNALTGLAIGGTALAASACQNSSQTEDITQTSKRTASSLNIPKTPSTLLLNKARAHDIMEAEKVDLLICSTPQNIYYLTNQRPMTYRLGMNDHAYATLSSNLQAPPTYVMGRYEGFFGGVFDTDIRDQLNYRLFSVPEDMAAFAELTDIQDIIHAPANNNFYPRLHPEHELAPHIQIRRDTDARTMAQHYATAEAALLKQLFETDLKYKTVAIDHPKLRLTLEKSGLDLRIVDGERLIRKIRRQKTPQELELMRYAINANVASARAAAQSVSEGATLQDIRLEFSKNCASFLSTPYWMVIDGIVPELVPGKIERGRTFMIDCVSEFQGYKGDFGRTICVGDPTRQMQSIVNALSHVWDRLMPLLKPGTKYSDLYAASAALFAETNVDAGFAINPHSVGLNHSDEPSDNDFGLWNPGDVELVENMVLSVDMPVLDSGWGGTAHLEDLVLIGKDGPELLNSSDDRFIVV